MLRATGLRSWAKLRAWVRDGAQRGEECTSESGEHMLCPEAAGEQKEAHTMRCPRGSGGRNPRGTGATPDVWYTLSTPELTCVSRQNHWPRVDI